MLHRNISACERAQRGILINNKEQLGSNVQSDLIANNRLNYAQYIHGSKTRCHSFVNTAREKLEQIRFAGTNFLGAIFLFNMIFAL